MARPRTPLLSLEKIHTGALELVDELGDFTIPQLAQRLGVSPSSLYHHVQGRPEIINGMRSIIGAQALAGFPPGDGSWQEQAAAWTRNYRKVLSLHAKAIPLLVGEAVTDSPTLEIYERLAALLAGAGFDDAQVDPWHLRTGHPVPRLIRGHGRALRRVAGFPGVGARPAPGHDRRSGTA